METPRLMFASLKHCEWSNSKNIKVQIIGHTGGKVFVFAEFNDKNDKYQKFIQNSINEYCKDKPEQHYLPM
jgi:hypothetical protein